MDVPSQLVLWVCLASSCGTEGTGYPQFFSRILCILEFEWKAQRPVNPENTKIPKVRCATEKSLPSLFGFSTTVPFPTTRESTDCSIGPAWRILDLRLDRPLHSRIKSDPRWKGYCAYPPSEYELRCHTITRMQGSRARHCLYQLGRLVSLRLSYTV